MGAEILQPAINFVNALGALQSESANEGSIGKPLPVSFIFVLHSKEMPPTTLYRNKPIGLVIMRQTNEPKGI